MRPLLLSRGIMEAINEADRIKDLIKMIADDLVECGNCEINFEEYKFYFQEMEYANPLDFSSMTMISLVLPPYISRDIDFTCGVTYESTYGNNSKTTYMNRIKACRQLAEQFVYKVLPKIDFKIRKEVNNKEVEDILNVLDG